MNSHPRRVVRMPLPAVDSAGTLIRIDRSEALQVLGQVDEEGFVEVKYRSGVVRVFAIDLLQRSEPVNSASK